MLGDGKLHGIMLHQTGQQNSFLLNGFLQLFDCIKCLVGHLGELGGLHISTYFEVDKSLVLGVELLVQGVVELC